MSLVGLKSKQDILIKELREENRLLRLEIEDNNMTIVACFEFFDDYRGIGDEYDRWLDDRK